MFAARVVTETQSAWIADQMRKYRNVPRTPEAWKVLFGAFSRRFPRGGLRGEPITLARYKSHARYVECKMGDGDEPRRASTRSEDGVTTRSKRRVAEIEDDESVDDAATPRPRRKLRTNAALRESEQHRLQARAPSEAVVKEEVVRHDLECARLRKELDECKTTLKRVKHNAAVWKAKYEELLASKAAKKVSKQQAAPQSFAFTINVNVDVSKEGKLVQTESHAVNINHDESKRTEAKDKEEKASAT